MLKDRQYIQALLKQPEFMQRIMAYNHEHEAWLQQAMHPAFFTDLVHDLYDVPGAGAVRQEAQEAKDGQRSKVTVEQESQEETCLPDANLLSGLEVYPDLSPIIDLISRLAHEIPASASGFYYKLKEQSPQAQALWHKLYASNPNLLLFRKKTSQFEIFTQPLERLCLLNADELAILSLYLGASRFGNQISKIVWRKQREMVLSNISDEVYRFCLNSGRFLIEQIDKEHHLFITNTLSYQLKIEGIYTLASLVSLFEDARLQAYWLHKLATYKAQLLWEAALSDEPSVDNQHGTEQGVGAETEARTDIETEVVAGTEFEQRAGENKPQAKQVITDVQAKLNEVFKPSYCEHSQRIASLCQRILALKVDRKWMQYLS